MDKKRKLAISRNPWKEPPEAVVKKGMPAVLGYFADLFAEGVTVRRNMIKVVLVGQEGAGKTRCAGVCRVCLDMGYLQVSYIAVAINFPSSPWRAIKPRGVPSSENDPKLLLFRHHTPPWLTLHRSRRCSNRSWPLMCLPLMPHSLRQSLRNRRPTPTSGPEESTVQIDVEEMKMDVDGVSLRVYDCAGQVNVLRLAPF